MIFEAVDSKKSLIVASDVVSDINDSNQLFNMVSNASQNLNTVPLSSIADIGYFNAEQIASCENLNTNVFVKRPKSKNSSNNSNFSIDNLNLFLNAISKSVLLVMNLLSLVAFLKRNTNSTLLLLSSVLNILVPIALIVLTLENVLPLELAKKLLVIFSKTL